MKIELNQIPISALFLMAIAARSLCKILAAFTFF